MPFENDPILLGRLIQSFRHHELKICPLFQILNTDPGCRKNSGAAGAGVGVQLSCRI